MQLSNELREKILSVSDKAYADDQVNGHIKKEVYLTKEERSLLIAWLESHYGTLEGAEGLADIALFNLFTMCENSKERNT